MLAHDPCCRITLVYHSTPHMHPWHLSCTFGPQAPHPNVEVPLCIARFAEELLELLPGLYQLFPLSVGMILDP